MEPDFQDSEFDEVIAFRPGNAGSEGGESASRGTVWYRLVGASLSPGGTCAAALPTRRSQARGAEMGLTALLASRLERPKIEYVTENE